MEFGGPYPYGQRSRGLWSGWLLFASDLMLQVRFCRQTWRLRREKPALVAVNIRRLLIFVTVVVALFGGQ